MLFKERTTFTLFGLSLNDDVLQGCCENQNIIFSYGQFLFRGNACPKIVFNLALMHFFCIENDAFDV
jgi:hypothetical protein